MDRASTRRARTLAVPVLLIGAGALTVGARPLLAQTSDDDGGSTTGAIAGGALGLVSGAVLGVAGSLVPCSQTYAGPGCVRLVAGGAGAIGLASGIRLGAVRDEAVRDRLVGAGIGFGIGLGIGLAMGPAIERFDWRDRVAVGLLGAAVGAAPRGAGIGAAVGSLAGLILWAAVPGLPLPDAVTVALGGLALGGLADWMIAAIEGEGAAPTFSISLPLGAR